MDNRGAPRNPTEPRGTPRNAHMGDSALKSNFFGRFPILLFPFSRFLPLLPIPNISVVSKRLVLS